MKLGITGNKTGYKPIVNNIDPEVIEIHDGTKIYIVNCFIWKLIKENY